jgi:hypothetical protein
VIWPKDLSKAVRKGGAARLVTNNLQSVFVDPAERVFLSAESLVVVVLLTSSEAFKREALKMGTLVVETAVSVQITPLNSKEDKLGKVLSEVFDCAGCMTE